MFIKGNFFCIQISILFILFLNISFSLVKNVYYLIKQENHSDNRPFWIPERKSFND